MNNALLTMIAIAVLFTLMIYFFTIRPIRQREKQHDQMVDALEKGDTVITAGGMYGTIEKIDEDSVVLKVESGTTIRVTKGGVIKRED